MTAAHDPNAHGVPPGDPSKVRGYEPSPFWKTLVDKTPTTDIASDLAMLRAELARLTVDKEEVERLIAIITAAGLERYMAAQSRSALRGV